MSRFMSLSIITIKSNTKTEQLYIFYLFAFLNTIFICTVVAGFNESLGTRPIIR